MGLKIENFTDDSVVCLATAKRLSTRHLVLPVHHQRSIVAVRRIFFCNKSTP